METNKQPWTLFWVDQFIGSEFSNIHFKQLNMGYPPFNFPDHLIDTVDLELFNEIEKLRIPLFIGSQFGFHPSLETLNVIQAEERIIAILCKSLLSGRVSGLQIARVSFVNNRCELDEIIFFKNE